MARWTASNWAASRAQRGQSLSSQRTKGSSSKRCHQIARAAGSRRYGQRHRKVVRGRKCFATGEKEAADIRPQAIRCLYLFVHNLDWEISRPIFTEAIDKKTYGTTRIIRNAAKQRFSSPASGPNHSPVIVSPFIDVWGFQCRDRYDAESAYPRKRPRCQFSRKERRQDRIDNRVPSMEASQDQKDNAMYRPLTRDVCGSVRHHQKPTPSASAQWGDPAPWTNKPPYSAGSSDTQWFSWTKQMRKHKT